MKNHLPEMVKELGEDYKSFLIAKTQSAFNQYESLLEAGTPPQEASELAKAELFPIPQPVPEGD